MADLGSLGFGGGRGKKGGFNSFDFLPFAGPLLSLFGLGKADTPDIPNLDDFGLGKKDISSFFNLRRAIGKAGIQRQGAQATRSVVSNLPSSLQTSTIPASIASGIQTRVGDQIAGFEGELAGGELEAMFNAFNAELQSAQLGLQKAQFEQGRFDDPFDALSLLPLFAGNPIGAIAGGVKDIFKAIF